MSLTDEKHALFRWITTITKTCDQAHHLLVLTCTSRGGVRRKVPIKLGTSLDFKISRAKTPQLVIGPSKTTPLKVQVKIILRPIIGPASLLNRMIATGSSDL